jgi:two-component system, cell cycle sensor histidine kinase and response regulator CckA
LHYEGCAEDITERKQAEASVRKLSQAVEQSPVSIVITDFFGKIEFVNTKFTQVTGYTPDEVIGRKPTILASGQTPRETYIHLWKTIRSGRVWQGEFFNRKKNGDVFLEQATIAAVKNAEGIITHFVAVKEDITERRRLEDQLRQTQKMESVGQLAGGVAHDFNNMLGVILGHAELALKKTEAGDPRHQNLEAIQAAGRRSVEITRQLLAFARKQTIMPKILDLNTTVEGMLKLLGRLIGEDIDLQWLPEADLWPIKMDPSQIDQILANLCVNARDAIAGVGKICIETHKIVLDEAYCLQHTGFTPGGFVMLVVSDDGSGMDKETLNKIFEPFFTTKGLGKGTGLGLATIYGIVKQNSGFINVYSEPGYGSVFKIYLPRCVVNAELPFWEEEKSNNCPPQGKETILLVEDDAAVLEMVKDVVLELGYTVLPAATPKEAVRLAGEQAGKIDLIITDLIMPEMTGRELEKHLTSLYPHLRCLYMSGYTNNVIAHQGVLGEGVNFIQKPFSQQDLAVKIRIALGKDKPGIW